MSPCRPSLSGRCRDESCFDLVDCLAVATSALPELDTLRKKLGEAESQLKARTEECDRLLKVEGELNNTVKQLTASVATLK